MARFIRGLGLVVVLILTVAALVGAAFSAKDGAWPACVSFSGSVVTLVGILFGQKKRAVP